jgi:hypothetical protein
VGVVAVAPAAAVVPPAGVVVAPAAAVVPPVGMVVVAPAAAVVPPTGVVAVAPAAAVVPPVGMVALAAAVVPPVLVVLGLLLPQPCTRSICIKSAIVPIVTFRIVIEALTLFFGLFTDIVSSFSILAVAAH